MIEAVQGNAPPTGSPVNEGNGICLRATGLVKSFRAPQGCERRLDRSPCR